MNTTLLKKVVQHPLRFYDIPLTVQWLVHWSSKAFENFLGSDIRSDILEAIQNGGDGKVDLTHFSPNVREYPPGDVTYNQGLEFLKSVPQNEYHEKFMCALTHWSKSVYWWERQYEGLSWEQRDAWRIEMGLKPINPTCSVGTVTVVFKRVGHGKFHFPEGYRFATEHEIPNNLQKDLPCLVRINGEWQYIERNHEGMLKFIGIRDWITYFHKNVFFALIVKE